MLVAAPSDPTKTDDALPLDEPESENVMVAAAEEDTRELALELAELFHDAVRVGDVESARSLLQRGAQHNEEDDDGKLPIHVAASRRDSEMVALLVASGACIDELDADGRTQLYCEAERNDSAGLAFLLRHGAKVDARGLEAKTALFAAAERGFDQIVRRLVDAKADVNAVDLQQRTPLCLAAKNGHLSCVRLLVTCGAAVDAKQALGRTPLQLAASNGHVDVVEHLLELSPASVLDADERQWTALHAAAGNNRVAVAKVLLEKHAPVDASRAPDGATALHLAAQRGFVGMVKLLVEYRAALDGKQGDGKTALLVALEHDNVAVAQALVDAGASVEARDASGSSPLLVAATRNHSSVVNSLVDRGAPVNAADAKGKTALMVAAKLGHLKIAKRLVDRGAEVDATQEFGRSALMLALSHRQRMVARWLLDDCRASVKLQDHAGWTPLHVAAASSDSSTIRALVQKGAVVDARSHDGKTALDLAVKKGFGQTVEELARLTAADAAPLDSTALLLAAARSGRLNLMMAQRRKSAALHREASGDVETVLLNLVRWGFRSTTFKDFLDHSFKDARGDNAVLLRDTLARMHALCADVKESEGMFESVATRLRAAVESGMDAIRADDEIRTEVTEIVYRFCRLLLQYRRHSTVPRFMARHTVNTTLRDFHSEIDRLLRRPGLQDDQNRWRTTWESVEKNQLSQYRAALERVALQELPSEADRVEAATHLQYMLTNRGRIEPSEGEVAKNAIEKLVSSCGGVDVDVPRWFLSRFDVEFDRWSCAKAGQTVKTTWMSSSVNVLPTSVDDAQFHQIVTAWKQLKHSNVVDLFGACHVGEPRFLVCDSVQDENLKAFLRKRQDQATLFSKLHEVAQGLLFLHESGVVHGNLTSDRILIGVDGKTKIGGFECGVLVGGHSHGYCQTNTDWTAPEVQRGGLPTVKADIFSFGVCIFDMLTMRDSWRARTGDSLRRDLLRSSSSPPPGVPNRKHWVLIKQMCATNPTLRVGLQFVMATLESFDVKADVNTQCEASSSSPGGQSPSPDHTVYTDLRAWRADAKDPLQDRLVLLKEQCCKFPEARKLAEFIYRRLNDVFELLVAKKLTSEEKVVKKFVKALGGFSKYLSPPASSLSHTKRVRSQRIAFGHEGFHQKIDELLEILGVSAEKNTIHDWKGTHHELVKTLAMSRDESASGAAIAHIVTVRNVKSLKRDPLDQTPAVSVRSSLPRTKDWFIDLSKIELDEQISKGGFGEVYRGTWMPGTPVVVKFLIRKDKKEEDKNVQEVFLHEVEIWYPLRHAHVVRLFGACVDKRYFVCEDATNGTLSAYLQAKATTLSAEKLRELAWTLLHQAALGLQFCHNRNVIHNDLKCDNILIGADGKAKLSDFGLSSMPDVADLLFKEKGMMGARPWKAPEYIQHGIPSFPSDIYSFAMCIVEAMSVVDPATRSEPPAILRVVRVRLKRGQRPKDPTTMRSLEWALVARMTEEEDSHRASIASVVEQLKVIAEEAEDRDVTEF